SRSRATSGSSSQPSATKLSSPSSSRRRASAKSASKERVCPSAAPSGSASRRASARYTSLPSPSSAASPSSGSSPSIMSEARVFAASNPSASAWSVPAYARNVTSTGWRCPIQVTWNGGAVHPFSLPRKHEGGGDVRGALGALPTRGPEPARTVVAEDPGGLATGAEHGRGVRPRPGGVSRLLRRARYGDHSGGTGARRRLRPASGPAAQSPWGKGARARLGRRAGQRHYAPEADSHSPLLRLPGRGGDPLGEPRRARGLHARRGLRRRAAGARAAVRV